MEQSNESRLEEIDLVKILKAVIARWYLLIILAVIGGGLGYAYGMFRVAPKYSSQARMMVVSKSSSSSAASSLEAIVSDLRAGSLVTDDYIELIKAPEVLKQTIEDLDLDLTYKQLLNMIAVSNPDNTHIIQISVTSVDAQRAADIANTHAKNSAEFISEVMEVNEPYIFTKAEVSNTRTNAGNSRYAEIGLVIGLIIAIIIAAARDVTDERFHDESDVEKYLGITVLASVPHRSKVKGKASYYGYGTTSDGEEDK